MEPAIIGNPAGYLPEQGPIESVTIALPERQYLPVGPDWLRSWFTVALAVLVITSLSHHAHRADRVSP